MPNLTLKYVKSVFFLFCCQFLLSLNINLAELSMFFCCQCDITLLFVDLGKISIETIKGEIPVTSPINCICQICLTCMKTFARLVFKQAIILSVWIVV